jgi:hypothetical protein
MNGMRLLLVSGNRLLRTFLETYMAAGTSLRIDFIMEERLANARWAFFVSDVGLVFMSEIQNVG